jgi:hypothetical protein
MTALNWWAIIVSAVAMHLLGWAWYGPIFGKTWMALSGQKMDGGSKSDGMKAMAWGLIFSIIMSSVLAYVISILPTQTIACGVAAGAVLWLGFVATTMINMVLYERKPMKLFWLNSLYYLVALAIAGLILAAWR